MKKVLIVFCGLLLVGSAASAATLDRRIGKMATVKRDGAEIRQGKKVLATLKKGQQVRVHNIMGNYALVWFTLGGKAQNGYISLKDLDIPEEKKDRKERDYKVGQTVIVTARQAKLMLGKKVLGSIPEGTRLKIEKVKGHWFGVFAQIAGKKTYGWVKDTEVDYPPLEEPGEDKKGSGMR